MVSSWMGVGAAMVTSAFQAYATASLNGMAMPANVTQEETDKMEVSDWLELDKTSRWKYTVFFFPPNIVLNTFQTHFQLLIIRHTFCFTSTFSQKIRALFLVTVYTTVTRHWDSAPLVVSTILQRQPS